MIGIIGAMKIEIETIRSWLENTSSETVSGVEYVSGSLHGKQVVTAVCGIGKVAAAMCAQTMILRYSPKVIINTGVAGTLTTALSVGDVAFASAVCQHDMDTTAIGDEPGLISGLGLVNMPCDAALVESLLNFAKENGINAVSGIIASGDIFVADKGLKADIVSKFNAIACEMEGAAIGQVCHINNTPFEVVRAISDSADGSAEMSYTEFLPIAAKTASKMIEYAVSIL